MALPSRLVAGTLLAAAQSAGEGARSTSVTEAPQKFRKTYEITRPREKWTEDEHKRFVEALKVHGRAWAKIGETLGTKTSVQVRSHAQKHFNKLEKARRLNLREEQDDANGGANAGSGMRRTGFEMSESGAPAMGSGNSVVERKPDDGADTPFDNANLASSIAQAIAAQMSHWAQAHVQAASGAAATREQANQDAMTVEAVATAAAAAAAAAANAVISAAGESIQRRIRDQAARGAFPLPFLVPGTSSTPAMPGRGTPSPVDGGDAGERAAEAAAAAAAAATMLEDDMACAAQDEPKGMAQSLRDWGGGGSGAAAGAVPPVPSRRQQPHASPDAGNEDLVGSLQQQQQPGDARVALQRPLAQRPNQRPSLAYEAAEGAESTHDLLRLAVRPRPPQDHQFGPSNGGSFTRENDVNAGSLWLAPPQDGRLVHVLNFGSVMGDNSDPSVAAAAVAAAAENGGKARALFRQSSSPSALADQQQAIPFDQRQHHLRHHAAAHHSHHHHHLSQRPSGASLFPPSGSSSCGATGLVNDSVVVLRDQLLHHLVGATGRASITGDQQQQQQPPLVRQSSGGGAAGSPPDAKSPGSLADAVNCLSLPRVASWGGLTGGAARHAHPSTQQAVVVAAGQDARLPVGLVPPALGCVQRDVTAGWAEGGSNGAAVLDRELELIALTSLLGGGNVTAAAAALLHGGGAANRPQAAVPRQQPAAVLVPVAVYGEEQYAAAVLPHLMSVASAGMSLPELSAKLAALQATPAAAGGAGAPGAPMAPAAAGFRELEALLQLQINGDSATAFLQDLAAMQHCGDPAQIQQQVAALAAIVEAEHLSSCGSAPVAAAAAAAMLHPHLCAVQSSVGDRCTPMLDGAALSGSALGGLSLSGAGALTDITPQEVAQLEHAILVMQQATSMAGPLAALLRQPRWQHAMGAAAALTAANGDATRVQQQQQRQSVPPALLTRRPSQQDVTLPGAPRRPLRDASISQGSNNSPQQSQHLVGDAGGEDDGNVLLKSPALMSHAQAMGNQLLRQLALNNEGGMWAGPGNAAALRLNPHLVPQQPQLNHHHNPFSNVSMAVPLAATAVLQAGPQASSASALELGLAAGNPAGLAVNHANTALAPEPVAPEGAMYCWGMYRHLESSTHPIADAPVRAGQASVGGAAVAPQAMGQKALLAVPHRKRPAPPLVGRGPAAGKESGVGGSGLKGDRVVTKGADEGVGAAKLPRVREDRRAEAEQQDTATSGGFGNILSRMPPPPAAVNKTTAAAAAAVALAGGRASSGSEGAGGSHERDVAGQGGSSNGSDEGSNEPRMVSGSTPPGTTNPPTEPSSNIDNDTDLQAKQGRAADVAAGGAAAVKGPAADAGGCCNMESAPSCETLLLQQSGSGDGVTACGDVALVTSAPADLTTAVGVGGFKRAFSGQGFRKLTTPPCGGGLPGSFQPALVDSAGGECDDIARPNKLMRRSTDDSSEGGQGGGSDDGKGGGSDTGLQSRHGSNEPAGLPTEQQGGCVGNGSLGGSGDTLGGQGGGSCGEYAHQNGGGASAGNGSDEAQEVCLALAPPSWTGGDRMAGRDAQHGCGGTTAGMTGQVLHRHFTHAARKAAKKLLAAADTLGPVA